ncbi:hypothetical protein N7539_008710 [Penicillium diatomitis]|uniref:Uncharacterized protein n=1 Tax=Penicillium diatomitis TaxID=2819901 RepID=A0A9W9WR29_9EURO|nr:uncharacterized protein N7539_008710 [Penicillium diatomitis]KAJ5472141.1 hypothetical protein N7539_008710 [Penicillium diatomitis]
MRTIFQVYTQLACILSLVNEIHAQTWKTQVNTTMCNWNQYRAIQFQQSIVFNGGSLWWQNGYSDGSLGIPENNENKNSPFLSFPLSTPFDTQTTNVTALFSAKPRSRIQYQNFRSGAMFGSDEEILLYGGVTRETDTKSSNSANLLGYRSATHPSELNTGYFFNSTLPSTISESVTSGSQVSVPSESLAFYFGGMRGKDWGQISSDDGSADTAATTLIMVNMGISGDQKVWKNFSLPTSVVSRADSQMVWIPVSERGILAVIGGVLNPQNIFPTGLSVSQAKQNKERDPEFMRQISIYDIAREKWFLQGTTGDIPSKAYAAFCAVVASASDGSSHNIYIYGGYDGQDALSTPYDDVYILSLPSFVWTKAYTGRPQYGRSGHQCFRILPDRMLIVGGLYKDPSLCLQDGFVRIFDLNTLAFNSSYSPYINEDYLVPDPIIRQIGGSNTGNATASAPILKADPELVSILNTKYTKPIPTWYPYAEGMATSVPLYSPAKSWVVPLAVGLIVPSAVLMIGVVEIDSTPVATSLKTQIHKVHELPGSPANDTSGYPLSITSTPPEMYARLHS